MGERTEPVPTDMRLHVSRMVDAWSHHNLGTRLPRPARVSLVEGIERLMNEARADTRVACERAIAGRRPAQDGENLVRAMVELLESTGALPR